MFNLEFDAKSGLRVLQRTNTTAKSTKTYYKCLKNAKSQGTAALSHSTRGRSTMGIVW